MRQYSVQISKYSDVGDRKPTNQDNILAKSGYINKTLITLCIVADGVGGLSRGEEISKFITDMFDLWFQNLISNGKITENISTELDEQISLINKKAVEYSNSCGEKMGSTIVLFFTVGKKYYVKNVGDSRAYKITKNGMVKLSKDDTYVALLLEKKEITQEESRNFKNKNYITQCIGVNDEIDIHTSEGVINCKEQYMICSDGYYNYADADKSDGILFNKIIPFTQKAFLLRNTIPTGQAKDNVSVILLNYKSMLKLW